MSFLRLLLFLLLLLCIFVVGSLIWLSPPDMPVPNVDEMHVPPALRSRFFRHRAAKVDRASELVGNVLDAEDSAGASLRVTSTAAPSSAPCTDSASTKFLRKYGADDSWEYDEEIDGRLRSPLPLLCNVAAR